MRKEVSCANCEYSACTTCIKQFLISTSQDPKCANCKHLWDQEFLFTILPKTWVKTTLKTHRQDLMYDKQMAMMPATQPFVQEEREREKAYLDLKAQLADLWARAKALRDKRAGKGKGREKWVAHRALKKQIVRVSAEIQYNRGQRVRGTVQNETPRIYDVFVRPCPKDACKGFLSKRDWKCGTCDTLVCKECAVMLDTGVHVCKKEDVESMQLIAKECRACPTCKAPTFKVDGCSQVWCVACKTAFNWNTGVVDNGRIHAPDYYQWLRSQNSGQIPREAGDRPNGCCGEANLQQTFHRATDHIMRLVVTNASARDDMIAVVSNLWRVTGHIEHVSNERRRLQRAKHLNMGTGTDEFTEHLKLRVRYMMDAIDEKTFKSKLYADEKARRFFVLYNSVIDTMVAVVAEVMNRIIQTNTLKNLRAVISEIDCVRRFVNEQMEKLKIMYDYKVPIIDESWAVKNV